MRIMFISDIHGTKTNLELIKNRYEELKCEKLVVLGDLYYIGPRNKMNEGYDIKYVQEFLSSFKDNLICIRGNCDSDVDVMVSDFPIVNELGLISLEGRDIYLTHGHIYNEDNWTKNNSVLVYGHLHIPFIKEKDGNIYLNPGSISLPKSDVGPTYLVLEDNKFIIYNISNEKIIEKQLF